MLLGTASEYTKKNENGEKPSLTKKTFIKIL